MSDLSREAQAIIDAARGADEPGPADLQRVRAAVYAELGIPAAGAHAAAGSATATSLTSNLVLKLVLGLVLVGGLVGGGYALLSGSDDESSPVAAAPPEPDPAPGPLPAPAPAPAPDPAPAISRDPPPRPPATSAPAPSRILSEAPREARTESKDTIETLREEKALIDAASRALAAGDGTAAMAALDRHARKFPRGQLTSERLGTRVLALCALDRGADASREAKRFLSRYPQHPMASRVRAACAD
ncbi:MAG TPA: hypothetical protein VML75_12895 [Kofleriaceae bacterium]|nr:hypothetical protein [Kofleriaceae bacterium]